MKESETRGRERETDRNERKGKRESETTGRETEGARDGGREGARQREGEGGRGKVG